MIDKTFIEKIESLVKPEVMEISGRQYTSKTVHAVVEPTAVPLDTHTITSIADYIGAGDHPGKDKVLIHVEEYNRVLLRGMLLTGWNPFRQREALVIAEARDLRHHFNAYMPVDEFVVYLLSMFVQDETTANIMRVVGNITQGSEMNFEDDGVTQRVTAKAGVARVDVVPVPNPVTLRPFRTFPDIEQPASKFILRVRAGNGESPSCALYEADGGAWKNTAISTIKEWFAKNVEGVQVIA